MTDLGDDAKKMSYAAAAVIGAGTPGNPASSTTVFCSPRGLHVPVADETVVDCETATEPPDCTPEACNKSPLTSLAVPLAVGDTPLGVLVLDNFATNSAMGAESVSDERRSIDSGPLRRPVSRFQELGVEHNLNDFHCGPLSTVYSTASAHINFRSG